MQDKLCLGCSSTVPAGSKPASIFVHSCCSKPICQNCLAANPRLATFCPICEHATSAFNKGPRYDVTRTGQTLFDLDKALESMNGDGEPTSEPPAYTENVDPAAQNRASRFVIDDEDASESIPDITVSSKSLLSLEQREALGPDILQCHASKSSAGAELDTTVNCNSPFSQARIKLDPHHTNKSEAASSSSPKMAKAGDGETRQYWLQKQDTLQSIAIRLGVSSNELCLLNALPRSVLSTSPHLLHTRSFILLPAYAVEKQLRLHPEFRHALEGPPQRSPKEKTVSARRGAEARFRALLLREGASSSRSRSDVETPADEKAARAYIGLAEDELRLVDFGEGTDKLGFPRSYEDADAHSLSHDVMLQAQIDTARNARFDAILSQAIARWEMDTDWERSQRAQGLDPTSMSHSSASISRPESKTTPSSSHSGIRSWFSQAVSSENPRQFALRSEKVVT